MEIEERVRQLRKSIPSAIAELSAMLYGLSGPDNRMTWRQLAERRAAAIDAASEIKVLAASLQAATDAALSRLIPPPPAAAPIPTPSPDLPRPGSPSRAFARAATADVQRG